MHQGIVFFQGIKELSEEQFQTAAILFTSINSGRISGVMLHEKGSNVFEGEIEVRFNPDFIDFLEIASDPVFFITKIQSFEGEKPIVSIIVVGDEAYQVKVAEMILNTMNNYGEEHVVASSSINVKESGALPSDVVNNFFGDRTDVLMSNYTITFCEEWQKHVKELFDTTTAPELSVVK